MKRNVQTKHTPDVNNVNAKMQRTKMVNYLLIQHASKQSFLIGVSVFGDNIVQLIQH